MQRPSLPSLAQTHTIPGIFVSLPPDAPRRLATNTPVEPHASAPLIGLACGLPSHCFVANTIHHSFYPRQAKNEWWWVAVAALLGVMTTQSREDLRSVDGTWFNNLWH